MYVWDESWLASRAEEAIEPDLPIIDPHHHLWEREGMSRYMLDDLHADTGAGHNVEATVFVDCVWGYRESGPEHLRPVGETETVTAMAEHDDSGGAEIRAIVSFADMTRGDGVTEVLEAHLEAGHGRFRGVRHSTAHDADPRVRRSHTHPTPKMLEDPQFRRGVACLGPLGLTFDAYLYHPQLPELTALARALPEVTIILDHIGAPLGVGPYEGRRNEVLATWRSDIGELASCPNVVVKLGGIGMPIYGMGYEQRAEPPSSDEIVDAWGGPIAHVIERFGADRCMFESNFPVDKVSAGYVTLWNSFKKMAAGASTSEKAALFHDTAARVYRV